MIRRPARRLQVDRSAVPRPRWVILAALLLAVALPVQGIALSLEQAWRPAHIHLHSATCGHRGATPMPAAASRIVMGSASSDSDQRPALLVALSDDAVIDTLPASGTTHRHDTGGNDMSAGAIAAGSADVSHDGVGRHRHALGDPDVVFIDDSSDPDKAATGMTKASSDGMVMLPPAWPASLSGRRGDRELPAPPPAYATRTSVPLDRPPA